MRVLLGLMLLALAAHGWASTWPVLGRPLVVNDSLVVSVPFVAGWPLTPLPDSLRQRLEAGDSTLVAQVLVNRGCLIMDGLCERHALLFPQSVWQGLWPTPSGWVRKLRVEHDGHRWWVYQRAADGKVVEPWRPSPSPSYCIEEE